MHTAAAAASLPEDVLLEILFRLKDVPANLFRCAVACKRWGHLVGEPAFLGRCWPDHDVSSSCFVGFFTPIRTPCFTPVPQQPALFPHLRALGTLMPAAPAGIFKDALPLVSRHGILLVRLDTIATRGYTNTVILDLAVCNLLTGTCHMLPTHKFGAGVDEHGRWNAYAILTDADYRCSNDDKQQPVVLRNTSLLFFKVVIISSCDRGDMKSSLHTFSSEEGTWKVFTNCFNGTSSSEQPMFSNGAWCRAIVRRGFAHWLFGYYGGLCFCVINLNIRTGHVSVTKLPYHKGHPFLTLAVNGALSLLWAQDIATTHLQIEVWEQQDQEQPNKDGGLEWICTRIIELEQPWNWKSKRGEICILAEKFGTLFIHDTINGVYTTDLQTRIIDKLVDYLPRRSLVETVPMEVDWPAIFASLLDTTRKQKMENHVAYPPGWEIMYLLGNERRKTMLGEN